MAGKLQNEDFKSETELTNAGGTKAQLLNDTKIYVTGSGINKTLDDAIVDGDIGGGGAALFTDLTDTPANYTSQKGKIVKVKNDETGVEFSTENEGSASIYQILNAESETDMTAWTASGTGSLALETVAPLNGTQSYKFTMDGTSAFGDTVLSKIIDVPLRSQSIDNQIELVMNYDGNDNDLEIRFFDVTGAVELSNYTSVQSGVNKTSVIQGIPASTLQVRFEVKIISPNNGAVLIWDDVEFNDAPFRKAQIGYENNFSARIANNGTATITSTNAAFIQSVNRSALGIVVITFVPDFFSEIPAVTGLVDAPNGAGRSIYVDSISTTSIQVNYRNNGSSVFEDNDFTIDFQRQGSDYKKFADNVITEGSSDENVFSARIDGSAGAGVSVISQSSDFIDSVSEAAAGSFNVNFKAGFFTEIPSVNATVLNDNGWFVSVQSISTTTMNVRLVSHLGTAAANDFDIVLQRQGADYIPEKNRLYALPVSKENNFTSRISNNGTATVTTKNADFIQSVNRSTAGQVDIVFVSGFFTSIPKVSADLYKPSSASTAGYATAFAVTTSGFSVATPNSSPSLVDQDFTIDVDRQGSDYTPQGVWAGNVAPVRVMKLKDVKAGAGGSFSSGAWRTRDLNVIEGDIFGSLAANQFTLPIGEYEFIIDAPAYLVNAHRSSLYNVTNSSFIEYGSSVRALAGIGESSTVSRIFTKASITSTTVFEVRHIGQTTRNTDGFGATDSTASGVDNVYTQVQITKLK